MPLVYFDGHIIEEKAISFVDCKRLRYGDSIFESILLHNNVAPLFSYHLDRLKRSADALKLDFATLDFLLIFKELSTQNHIKQDARIRITIWRAHGNLYTPNGSKSHILIECEALETKPFEILPNLGVYHVNTKNIDEISGLKSGNALLYVLAKISLQATVFDDYILLNSRNEICEATSSNIFFVSNKKLFTPSLSSGCVAGVMRSYLIDRFNTTEFNANLENLDTFDEIFLTNAVQLVRPVGKVNSRDLTTIFTEELIKELSNLYF